VAAVARGAFGYPLNGEPPGLTAAGATATSEHWGGLRLSAGQGEASSDMSFDCHARHAGRAGSATQHAGT
jgi:hypothetical protein